MTALVRLGPDTSADWIRRHIEYRTGRRVAITAVHTTLQRLAARGYTASWTRPTMRRRPRLAPDWWRNCSDSLLSHAARRFHRLQTSGRRALRLTIEVEDVLRAGLPGLGRESAPYQLVQPIHRPSVQTGRPPNRRQRKRLALEFEAGPAEPLPEARS